MNNAELFKRVFGISATEFWTYTETEMLNWLSTDVPDTNVEDTISRQVAINALRHVDEYNGRSIETIRNLPSAQQWIPVTERVPEVGTYIVTGKQKYDWEDKWRYFVDVAYCPGNYVDFFWDTFNDWDEGQETHIIAWMPLPEPWKGGADD